MKYLYLGLLLHFTFYIIEKSTYCIVKIKTMQGQRYKDLNLQTFGPLSRFEHGPTPFLCPSLVMAHRFPLHNKISEDHTFEKVPTKESCIMFIQ